MAVKVADLYVADLYVADLYVADLYVADLYVADAASVGSDAGHPPRPTTPHPPTISYTQSYDLARRIQFARHKVSYLSPTGTSLNEERPTHFDRLRWPNMLRIRVRRFHIEQRLREL